MKNNIKFVYRQRRITYIQIERDNVLTTKKSRIKINIISSEIQKNRPKQR